MNLRPTHHLYMQGRKWGSGVVGWIIWDGCGRCFLFSVCLGGLYLRQSEAGKRVYAGCIVVQ